MQALELCNIGLLVLATGSVGGFAVLVAFRLCKGH